VLERGLQVAALEGGVDRADDLDVAGDAGRVPVVLGARHGATRSYGAAPAGSRQPAGLRGGGSDDHLQAMLHLLPDDRGEQDEARVASGAWPPSTCLPAASASARGWRSARPAGWPLRGARPGA